MLARILLAVSACAFICTTSRAIDGTWTQTSGGNWSTAANWSSTPDIPGIPGTNTDIARFLGAITANSTVTVDSSVLLNQIVFNNAAFSYTLSGSNAITLDGATPTLSILAGSHTITANITSTSTITVAGPGTLTLSGTNGTSAFTVNSGGTLRFTAAVAMGVSPVVYNLNTGTIGFDFTATLATGRTFVLTGTANAFDVGNATNTLTIPGVISGSGGFTKTGPGTLSLTTATNTYSGPTTITAGALQINSDARLGTVPGVATPGNIVFNGGLLQSGSTFTLNANRGILLNAGSQTINQTANTLTYAGIIAGAGRLVKTGAGSVLLTGTANTYTGGTSVLGGTLRIAADLSLGAVPGAVTPGSIVIDNGTLQSTINSAFTVATNRGIALGTGANIFDIQGSAVTINGVIANQSTASGFTKTGGGVLVLSGTNTLTGAVTVNQGTLRGNVGGALGTGVNLTVLGTGSYDVTTTLSATTSMASITLTNGQLFSSNVGNSPALTTAAWTLTNGIVAVSLGGTNGLIKTGLGTVTMIPNNFISTYSFTGGTTISSGAMYYPAGSASVFGGTSNVFNLNGGAMVFGPGGGIGFGNTRTVNLGSSTTTIIDGGTGGVNSFTANVLGATGDGGFHKTGSGTFSIANSVVSGSNSWSGPTTLWNGELRATSVTSPFATGIPATTAVRLSGGVWTLSGANTLIRNLGAALGEVGWAENADGGFAAFNAASTVNLGGAASTLIWGMTPDFVQSGRSLVLGGTNANNVLTLANPVDLNGAIRSVIVPLGTGVDGANATLVDSSVGGTGGLIKSGGGLLSLTGGSAYTSSTTIAGGALEFPTIPVSRVSFAAGSPVSGGVFILSGGAILGATLGNNASEFSWAGSGGFAARGGALTVTFDNDATLTWAATNFFVTAADALVFGAPQANANVTLTNLVDLAAGVRTVSVLGQGATVTLTNGGLIKSGPGTLTLGGSSSLSSITVAGGTLNLGGTSQNVGSAVISAGLSNGTLTSATDVIIADNTLTISAVIAGSVGVLKSGPNTATLSAANTYNGATTVRGTGRILIASPGGSALFTSALDIAGTFPSSNIPSLGGMITVSLTNGQDRLPTPASGIGTLPVFISGGSLSTTGATGVSVVQNYANLSLGSGGAQLYLSPSVGQQMDIRFNPFVGDALGGGTGSSLLVAGTNLGNAPAPDTSRVFFLTNGTQTSFPASPLTGSVAGSLPVGGGGSGSGTTIGILRGVFTNVLNQDVNPSFTYAAAANGMATYDTNGIRPLNTATEYAAQSAVPVSNANIRVTATQTLTAGTYTINSLTIIGSTTANVAYNQGTTPTVLNITSGNVLITYGNNLGSAAPTIGSGTVSFTLAFGTNPAHIYVGNPSTTGTTDPGSLRAVITAALTSSGGLIKSGPGIFTWGTAAGNSNITGTLYFNAGTVQIGAFSGTLQVNNNPIGFNGGTMSYTAGNTGSQPPGINATLINPVTLGAAGGTIDLSGGSTGSGQTAFHALPNTGINFTSLIDGIGTLTKTGPGGLILQNNNTYSGGTILRGGVLVAMVANAANNGGLTTPLGIGPLTLASGTLMVAGSTTQNAALTVSAPVNFAGESSIAYVGQNPGSTLVSGFNPIANVGTPAPLVLSGPITITTSIAHHFTNNLNTAGYSVLLSGMIGEATAGSGLLFAGVSTSFPAGNSPNFTPSVATATSLTGTAITGINTFTGSVTVRQGILNPNASVIANQNGPLGNSSLPVVMGDPGGGAFAGLLFDADGIIMLRTVQLQMAGTAGNTLTAASVYLGTVLGRTGGSFTGGIQLANRTLHLFSGGGTTAAPMVVSGVISDGGQVLHSNIGSFANTVTSLTAANIYSGGTTVGNGTLLINNTTGSGTGTGSVFVLAAGTLGGTGTLVPNLGNQVSIIGTVAPGNGGIGTLKFGTAVVPAAVGAPGTYAFELALSGASAGTDTGGSTPLASQDAITIFGAASFLSGTVTITSLGSTGLDNTMPYSWQIATASSGITGTPTLGTVSGTDFVNAQSVGNFSLSVVGNNLFLNFTPVPEPMLLLGVAVLGFAAVRRRKL